MRHHFCRCNGRLQYLAFCTAVLHGVFQKIVAEYRKDGELVSFFRQYVQGQHFTSTAEIMSVMKEMFREVIQQVMEVEMDEELGRERCQRSDVPGNSTPNYRNLEMNSSGFRLL